MFKNFAEKVNQRLNWMAENRKWIFRVDVDGYQLWEKYLKSFPEGTNNLYRERTEHDCSICRHFVVRAGNLVTINPDTLEIETVWDVENIPYPYNEVAAKLAKLVRNGKIEKPFYTSPNKSHYGCQKNLEHIRETNQVVEWHHFWWNVPEKFIVSEPDCAIGAAKTNFSVLSRTLGAGEDSPVISLGVVDVVIDLIKQGSIYRGNEFLPLVEKFKEIYESYLKVELEKKELFIWNTIIPISGIEPIIRIKNLAIGTLLENISSGMDLEEAVRKYEAVVAPTNYKRSKPIVTPKMVEQAKETLQKEGLLEAIYFEDVKDVGELKTIWRNRQSKFAVNDVFEELKSRSSTNEKRKPLKFDEIAEVPIEKFLSDIVPKAEKIELYLENKLIANTVALFKARKSGLLKWDNPYSWIYTELGTSDSVIKQKVKAAGGNVEAPFRASLHWYNIDDLDLHLRFKNKHVYHERKKDWDTGCNLDVDMNVRNPIEGAVENIVFPDIENIPETHYRLYCFNYRKRTTEKQGFEIELEYVPLKQKFLFVSKNNPDAKMAFEIEFDFIKEKGIHNITIHPSYEIQKITVPDEPMKAYNLDTLKFVEVEAVLLSPNYWEKSVGNKHYIFVLKDMKRDFPVRPFVNEYIRHDIYQKHKRVLEILGDKLKVEPGDAQTMGLGFSETKKTSFVVKVYGSFERTIKVVI